MDYFCLQPVSKKPIMGDFIARFVIVIIVMTITTPGG